MKTKINLQLYNTKTILNLIRKYANKHNFYCFVVIPLFFSNFNELIGKKSLNE